MVLEGAKKIYEDKYKQLMIIPFAILIIAIAVLLFWKVNTGEFVSKDVSLKGGILVTVQTDEVLDIIEAEKQLEDKLNVGVSVRSLKAIGGAKIGYIFEIGETDLNGLKLAIQEITGIELKEGSYTIEEMSSSLSSAFWNSTIKAIIIALIFMSAVVFFFFRVPIPSGAIVLAAVSDVIGTIAIMNLLGIKLSTAGVAALLMLLGYSVDSDILLSTKLLKRTEGSIMDRTYSAIKTGLTMQITTLVALSVLYFVSPAALLKQIAIILVIGLLLDILNTWIQNVGILRWYKEVRGE